MDQLYLSNTDLEKLAKLQNDILVSITAEDLNTHSISFGNILVVSDTHTLEIDNNYRLVKYFNDIDELAGYKINDLKSRNNFKPVVQPDHLDTKIINQKIDSIRVIRDNIRLDYGNKIDKYVIDNAIILELTDTDLLIGQTGFFSPVSKIIFDKDAINQYYTTTDIKDDWVDDDFEERGLSHPRYQVYVDREIIEI